MKTNRKSKDTRPPKEVSVPISTPTDNEFSPLDLDLDPLNPRLSPDEKGKSQKELIAVFLDRFKLEELAHSILASGFLPMDPFIAFRDKTRTVVLEGNRRLATLKLLLDPSLTPERHSATWDKIRENISTEVKESIQRIRVQVYQSRDDLEVLSYIGFRHVNGIYPWDAEEKAAFIARLIEDPKIQWSYEAVAEKLGSKVAYVEKLYVAHRLIVQSEDGDVPGWENMRRSFGVLTRALQSPGVTSFLKIDFPRDPSKSRRPSKAPARDLEDFVRWSFGTDDEKPLLNDSRDLTKWGQILASDESVRYIRSVPEPRFERAYSKSGGELDGLVESLLAASDNLMESVANISAYKSDSAVAAAVDKCARYIVPILSQFPKVAKKHQISIGDNDGTSSSD